jgi:hypothetical protein
MIIPLIDASLMLVRWLLKKKETLFIPSKHTIDANLISLHAGAGMFEKY